MPPSGAFSRDDVRLFTGNILLVPDIREITFYRPPPLCKIARDGIRPSSRKKVCITKTGPKVSVYLDDEPHDWLAERSWSYGLELWRDAVILELEEASRAVMFKLSWHGVG